VHKLPSGVDSTFVAQSKDEPAEEHTSRSTYGRSHSLVRAAGSAVDGEEYSLYTTTLWWYVVQYSLTGVAVAWYCRLLHRCVMLLEASQRAWRRASLPKMSPHHTRTPRQSSCSGTYFARR